MYEVHDVLESRFWRFLVKFLGSKTKAVIVISEGIKEELIKIGLPKDKIQVFHDCVDIKKFEKTSSKLFLRKKFNFSKDDFIISYVGNTEIIRDLDTFIEVSKKNPNFKFLVFGKERDYLILNSKKIKNFHFMGYTNDPSEIYSLSDVLFAGFTKKIPTINYMSPLKIFEYMASNKPIVVSDFPRTREILDNKSALFYKPRNIEDLSKQINLLYRDPQLSKNLSKEAKKIVKKYTWQNRAKNILNLYLK